MSGLPLPRLFWRFRWRGNSSSRCGGTVYGKKNKYLELNFGSGSGSFLLFKSLCFSGQILLKDWSCKEQDVQQFHVFLVICQFIFKCLNHWKKVRLSKEMDQFNFRDIVPTSLRRNESSDIKWSHEQLLSWPSANVVTAKTVKSKKMTFILRLAFKPQLTRNSRKNRNKRKPFWYI